MSHPPPVPPANRSNKGPGEPAVSGKDLDRGSSAAPSKAPNNTDEQGQSGNTKQNTTHQGLTQNR